MKRKIILLLALLFALFAVGFFIPRLLEERFPQEPFASETGPVEFSTETMTGSEFAKETRDSEEETESEEEPPDYGPGMEDEPTEPEEYEEEDPGPPVEREKQVTDILFASDVHYMSQSLTDYGKAFNELIDNGDGKVVRYMPQIWEAFSEEVIAARPDALVLSGDLTMDGEKVNHEELASRLAVIEDAGIPVLVIPGNHDINNPNAASYVGDSRETIENISPEEFRTIYGRYGYDQAASSAPDSLSYLYALNDTTWMLMLDTCIYEPRNKVDGRISSETVDWMRQCLKDAYSQGITVIPVGHHNLQELSRVYVDECVIENNGQVLNLLENYLTPAYFSGHLHVQRVVKHTDGPGADASTYGIWETVSNSLIIPPCQYGRLTCNGDGSLSYHTKNVDVSGWAAKHGNTNQDLLDFPAFSDGYIRSVISRQTYHAIQDVPDYIREELADYYADLYQDYYAGRQMNYQEKRKEHGYQLWDRFMNPSIQFRQVEGMVKDGMNVNNNAEIPNPIHLNRR